MFVLAKMCFFLLFCFGTASCGEPSILRLLEMAESQPVVLHARLIDQTGAPLSGISVAAKVWSMTAGGSFYDKRDLGLFTTGADGTLHISGAKAGYLLVSVKDNAYFLGDARWASRDTSGLIVRYSMNGSDRYWSVYGTQDEPVIITVWKKEGPQALVSISGEVRMEYTGADFGIDLARGQIVKEGGDLRVNIEVEADVEKRKAQSDSLGFFPYKVTVTVPDGGLSPYLGFEDSQWFEGLMGIPDTAYDVHKLDGPTRNSDKGTMGVPFMGFVSLRKGSLLGRVQFYIGMEPFYRSDRGRVVVRFTEGLLNPSGSRSLEVDQAKLTKCRLSIAEK